MTASGGNGPQMHNNHFTRDSMSSTPSPSAMGGRPKSFALPSQQPIPTTAGHNRHQSFSPLSGSVLAPSRTSRQRSDSNRSINTSSITFAPKFIKTDQPLRETEAVRRIEGENDFSGKRYVWIRDSELAFIKGWVLQEITSDKWLVQCEDGSVRYHPEGRLLMLMLTFLPATRGGPGER